MEYVQTDTASGLVSQMSEAEPEQAWQTRLDIARNNNGVWDNLEPVEVFGLAAYGQYATPSRLSKFVEVDQVIERASENGSPVLTFYTAAGRDGVDFFYGDGLNYGAGYGNWGPRIECRARGKNTHSLRRSEVFPGQSDDPLDMQVYAAPVEQVDAYAMEPGVGEATLIFGLVGVDDEFRPKPTFNVSLWEGVGDALPVVTSVDELDTFVEESPRARETMPLLLANLRSIAAGIVIDNRGFGGEAKDIYDRLMENDIADSEFSMTSEDPVRALGSIIFGK